eukprot:g2401.t1
MEQLRFSTLALLQSELRGRRANLKSATPLKLHEQLEALQQLRRIVKDKRQRQPKSDRKKVLLRVLNSVGNVDKLDARQLSILRALLASKRRVNREALPKLPIPVAPDATTCEAPRDVFHNSGRNGSDVQKRKKKTDPYRHLGPLTKRLLLPALKKKGTLVPRPKMGPFGVPHKGTSLDSNNVMCLFRGPGLGSKHYVSMTKAQFEDPTNDVKLVRETTGHVDAFPKISSEMSKFSSEMTTFSYSMRKPLPHRKIVQIHPTKFSAGQGNLPLSG